MNSDNNTTVDDSKTLPKLLGEMCKILNLDSIDADTGLAELGVDSLKVVELILVCDQLYSTAIDPEKLEITQFTTLRDLDRQLVAMSHETVEA